MYTSGLYFYGIINSDLSKILDNYCTKDGDKVYYIQYKDIYAVVGHSNMVNYYNMPKDILARLLVKHQMVIEEMMNLGNSIIPMKLGTLLNDNNEVDDILTTGYDLLKEIFEKINEKIEIDLAVTWNDLTTVLKEIGESTIIKDFKKEIFADSQKLTVENKIKIGTLIKNQLDQIRELISSDLLSALKECSDEIKIHSLMDDNMVANFALLINKNKQELIDKKIKELNSSYSEKLNFRCIGPLPPYSFYTLEVKKLHQEELNWAKKKLQLEGIQISKHEINKAYKSHSFLCHPDHNPNVAGTEKEFDEVNKAYKILNDYCHSCGQTNHGGNTFFDIAEFDKPALFVKLKD